MTAKKSGTPPDKQRKYDEGFQADALPLASESRHPAVGSYPVGHQSQVALPLAVGSDCSRGRQ